MTGASIVVYLGHGNGWPSLYRDQLTPSTQNGMGLNPNVGCRTRTSTSARTGSARRSSSRRTRSWSSATSATRAATPSRACPRERSRSASSASTTTRPASSGPARRPSSPRPTWGPSTTSGTSSAAAARSTGSGATPRRTTATCSGSTASGAPATRRRWTPTTTTSGFYRSIVLKDGLASANVLAGAVADVGRPILPPLEPTLSGLGVEFSAPNLATPPTAGATTNLTFHLSASDPTRPRPPGIQVGVRWDPLDGDDRVAAGCHDPVARAGGRPSPGSSAAPVEPSPTPERRPGLARHARDAGPGRRAGRSDGQGHATSPFPCACRRSRACIASSGRSTARTASPTTPRRRR